jgi:hypothetical protein
MCSKTSTLKPATSSVIISQGERGEQEAPRHHFCSATRGGHVHGVASASGTCRHSLRPAGCLLFFSLDKLLGMRAGNPVISVQVTELADVCLSPCRRYKLLAATNILI